VGFIEENTDNGINLSSFILLQYSSNKKFGDIEFIAIHPSYSLRHRDRDVKIDMEAIFTSRDPVMLFF
jgi:hypothetical protein